MPASTVKAKAVPTLDCVLRTREVSMTRAERGVQRRLLGVHVRGSSLRG